MAANYINNYDKGISLIARKSIKYFMPSIIIFNMNSARRFSEPTLFKANAVPAAPHVELMPIAWNFCRR